MREVARRYVGLLLRAGQDYRFGRAMYDAGFDLGARIGIPAVAVIGYPTAGLRSMLKRKESRG